ncbi:gamma-glutamyl-gamma-aminobutyrate hydrolase family protein [Liquorilactobacillus mali]|uniref:gamma-glutamyl-gamma-aminobutyrate hydrolase family protein n=1 Tax=Liquorilactobacillus mali TaxID=1618 RepID=UPI00235064B4|nr:gamma-glutamyl-gamma-aminobutyrate hydrolase family protein [Liquorilactobacillus mali]MDC7952887.1 gamma-glutamyl-gamma-aminobutyrate hydrolase family protein [Liquorilactobacillus mali]
MTKKPIIGISGSIIKDQGGIFPGYRRAYVNNDYIRAVNNNGGIALILPTSPAETAKQIIDAVDGLILSGGQDVSPFNYGEEIQQKCGAIFPERDKFEFALLEAAEEKKIPILGICRGAQIIDVYRGGSLYQDISYRGEHTLRHFQLQDPPMPTHKIKIAENSLLNKIMQKNSVIVNSFHHQLVKSVPASLQITGTTSDGVVEAFEDSNFEFFLGVQFHPEMLIDSVESANMVFQRMVEAAK